MSTTENLNLFKNVSILTETQKETLNTNGTVASGDKTVNLEDRVVYGVVNNKMPPLREPEITPSEDSVVTYGPNGQGNKAIASFRQVKVLELPTQIDNPKYGEYGEPEFVYGLDCLTLENVNNIMSDLENGIETDIKYYDMNTSAGPLLLKLNSYGTLGSGAFTYITYMETSTNPSLINIEVNDEDSTNRTFTYSKKTIGEEKRLYKHEVTIVDNIYQENTAHLIVYNNSNLRIESLDSLFSNYSMDSNQKKYIQVNFPYYSEAALDNSKPYGFVYEIMYDGQIAMYLYKYYIFETFETSSYPIWEPTISDTVTELI